MREYNIIKIMKIYWEDYYLQIIWCGKSDFKPLILK